MSDPVTERLKQPRRNMQAWLALLVVAQLVFLGTTLAELRLNSTHSAALRCEIAIEVSPERYRRSESGDGFVLDLRGWHVTYSATPTWGSNWKPVDEDTTFILATRGSGTEEKLRVRNWGPGEYYVERSVKTPTDEGSTLSEHAIQFVAGDWSDYLAGRDCAFRFATGSEERLDIFDDTLAKLLNKASPSREPARRGSIRVSYEELEMASPVFVITGDEMKLVRAEGPRRLTALVETRR